MIPAIKFDDSSIYIIFKHFLKEIHFAINANLNRKKLKYFLKNKLKSFLMNHFAFY